MRKDKSSIIIESLISGFLIGLTVHFALGICILMLGYGYNSINEIISSTVYGLLTFWWMIIPILILSAINIVLILKYRIHFKIYVIINAIITLIPIIIFWTRSIDFNLITISFFIPFILIVQIQMYRSLKNSGLTDITL